VPHGVPGAPGLLSATLEIAVQAVSAGPFVP